MLGQIDQQPYISPLQRRGMELRNTLDEALRLSPSAGSGAPVVPGAAPPGPAAPGGPPQRPSGGPTPLPQQRPSSPVMGALQQAEQQRRPAMTPMSPPFEVKRPAPPAAYAQAAGPVGFAEGGRVDFAVLRR